MRHRARVQRRLPTRQFARLPRRLARLRRDDALLAELLRLRGMLLEPRLQRLADSLPDEGLDLGVQEFFFGLIIERRVGQLHAHDRDQPLAQVVARGRGVFVLDDASLARIAVERARQGDLEALPVRAAVDVVDVGAAAVLLDGTPSVALADWFHVLVLIVVVADRSCYGSMNDQSHLLLE